MHNPLKIIRAFLVRPGTELFGRVGERVWYPVAPSVAQWSNTDPAIIIHVVSQRTVGTVYSHETMFTEFQTKSYGGGLSHEAAYQTYGLLVQTLLASWNVFTDYGILQFTELTNGYQQGTEPDTGYPVAYGTFEVLTTD